MNGLEVEDNAASGQNPWLNEAGGDLRWLLAQRIIASSTFKRATQLRKMLGFIVRFHIEHPGDQLREHDIATGVLGRRDDFDPAYDNIVRVQASHLRKKLAEYFESEGQYEALIIELPKGGYLPIFDRRSPAETEVEVSGVPSAPVPTVEAAEDHSASRIAQITSKWRGIVKVFAVVGLLLCAIFFATKNYLPKANGPAITQILSAVGQRGNKVFIVLPDTSLLMLQKLVGSEISVEQYSNSNFLQNLVKQADKADLRDALSFIGNVRATTLNEAEVGTDFAQAVRERKMEGILRYARDMHIRDLGADNYILIGNPRSNPWVSLFANRANFVFEAGASPEAIVSRSRTPAESSPEGYVFKNRTPAAGEQAIYTPLYGSEDGFTNYVDVILTSNLTGTGFVLIVNGSDVPANEAAARLLLQGHLPSEIEERLKGGILKTFEVLLRGHHRPGESNDQLDIVAYRVPHK